MYTKDKIYASHSILTPSFRSGREANFCILFDRSYY